jgi:purine-binding chemotaxis protein CheW
MTNRKINSQIAAGGAAKHLTFKLASESYGIPVLKVREIIRPTDITVVPRMPEYVRGVINLRGKIIPIVDLRMKFQLPAAADTDRTCIVVVEIATNESVKTAMGLIVDAVEEVASIAASEIEPAPNFGNAVDTSYILGMAKVKAAVKTLIDIDKLLVADVLAHLNAQSK